MAIRFNCIGCSNSISVHDSLRKREIRCPNCELKVRVPETSSLPAAPSKRASVFSEEKLPRSPEVDTVNEALCVDESTELPTLDESQEEPLHLPKNPNRKQAKSKPHHEKEDVEWDITPMVDVAFLLLIFFMLTAAFSIQKAIPSSAAPSESANPSAAVQEKVNSLSLVIQIDEYNGFTVVDSEGQTELASSKQELYTILADRKIDYGNETVKVLIQAHTDSIHGAAVACMDASRQAGFSTFQLQSVEQF